MGVKLGLFEREKHCLRDLENRVLRKIFGNNEGQDNRGLEKTT